MQTPLRFAPSPFLVQLNTRADAFRTAMKELTQLASAGTAKGAEPGTSKTLRRLGDKLRYARASRLHRVVTDGLLRSEIAQELRRIRPKTPRDFLEEIRRDPRMVLRLPGCQRVRQQIVVQGQSTGNVLESLLRLLLKWQENAMKDATPGQKTSITNFKKKVDVIKKKTQECANQSEDVVKEIATGVAIMVGQLIGGTVGGEAGAKAGGEAAAGIAGEGVTEVFLIMEQIIGSLDDAGAAAPASGGAAGAVADEAANRKCKCMEEVAQRRDACNGGCPPGRPGNACRATCEAMYLADLALCIAS